MDIFGCGLRIAGARGSDTAKLVASTVIRNVCSIIQEKIKNPRVLKTHSRKPVVGVKTTKGHSGQN